MKRLLFISALCLLLASCENKGEGGGAASLVVETSTLTFEAVSAPSQTVGVTAVGVAWEIRVAETASAWLAAVKSEDGKSVSMSVADNDTPDQRTGSVTVVPVDNDDVKSKTISVVQHAGDVEYEFAIDPASLEFEAEGAAAQTVTVTAEGGLTWTAAADGDAASWVTVKTGEGVIEISVSDNAETTERSGNVVVTPSVESMGKKAVRITQAGKVLPPSLSVELEDPEQTGLAFEASGAAKGESTVYVNAVNVEWSAKGIDADGNTVSWIDVTANQPEDSNRGNIYVAVTKNEAYEERIGYVLVSSKTEGIEDIRIKITQDAALQQLSTLKNDVDLNGLKHASVGVTPNQTWDAEDKASGWSIELMTEGLTKNTDGTYSGSGIKVDLPLGSKHMVFNDDNEYYLADGTYTRFAHDDSGNYGPEMTYIDGFLGFFEYQTMGSWVLLIENGEIVERGPFADGTVEVTRNGDEYTFTFSVMDDAEHRITGTCTVPFTEVKVLDVPRDPIPMG